MKFLRIKLIIKTIENERMENDEKKKLHKSIGKFKFKIEHTHLYK